MTFLRLRLRLGRGDARAMSITYLTWKRRKIERLFQSWDLDDDSAEKAYPDDEFQSARLAVGDSDKVGLCIPG